MTRQSNKVVVVGAGLVGAVQSLLLARTGFNVTVVERRKLLPQQNNTALFGGRTVALSHRSWQLLMGSNLWPDIDQCPIKSVHVTQQGKFGSVVLRANKLNVEALGYVVSNEKYERFLHAQLRSEPGVTVLESAEPIAVKNSTQSVSLELKQNGVEQCVDADLLIAADGTNSAVRKMLDVTVQERDYKQCVVVANVAAAKSHDYCAYERFTHSGPLALLPLANNTGSKCYSVILTSSEHSLAAIQQMSDSEFLELLQRKFGGKLGRFESVGEKYAAPLKLTVSAEQIINRCVLIGNSSRTLHPVAGQGLNLALRDVYGLVSVVQGYGVTSDALQIFASKRRRDQSLVTTQTDVLARLFTHKPWPVKIPVSLLNGSSLLLLDFVEPLKKSFASVNMGHHVPLPE